MFRIAPIIKAPKVRVLPRAKASVRDFRTTPRAQFFNKGPTPEEQEQALAKVRKALEAHPELRQLTMDFKTLLEGKGLLAQGRPSMTQMMRLLTDKDVIAHGAKLKKFLDTNDTGLTKDELATITGAYMFQGKEI
ncbi:uncharacterized protein LODBEIA_P49580 [Lodderomyces beijingensis]|uniref:Uncharacterized protein n=1 Tax=Lodderomyces beijingensis TaxID=1775926 RepID=A0ABP0ZRH2_9ASCO